MCLRLSRTCPGCGVVADSSETDTCDDPANCNGFATYKLPLRREHHNEWACSTPRCPFNHEYVYDLEREYLRVRLAQREGDVQTLAPHLTLDGKSAPNFLPHYALQTARTALSFSDYRLRYP
ncbi:hypothetical protein L209DRAFT_754752 [Thermothelomyces heterothallicus CBS 203.75]